MFPPKTLTEGKKRRQPTNQPVSLFLCCLVSWAGAARIAGLNKKIYYYYYYYYYSYIPPLLQLLWGKFKAHFGKE